MSLIPEFELGLWNAWIFILLVFIIPHLFLNKYRKARGWEEEARALIGGLLVTINAVRDQSILAFFNQASFTNFSMIGSILTVVGFAIALVGFALIIHYDRQKSWYYSEIEKSTMYKKGKNKYKTIDEALE